MVHNDTLAIAAEVEERTIHNVYNNTATVFWQQKGAAITTGPPAYLLRLQALHQQQFRYVLKHNYIPGKSNVMADFLLRAWHLTDVQIVAHFNSFFPQPVPWQICPLHKPMNSSLILALLKKRCATQLLLPTPQERLPMGQSSVISALVTKLTPSSEISPIPSHTCKSLQQDTETADFPQVVDPSGLKRCLMPSFLLHRNSHRWGPRTLGRQHTE